MGISFTCWKWKETWSAFTLESVIDKKGNELKASENAMLKFCMVKKRRFWSKDLYIDLKNSYVVEVSIGKHLGQNYVSKLIPLDSLNTLNFAEPDPQKFSLSYGICSPRLFKE